MRAAGKRAASCLCWESGYGAGLCTFCVLVATTLQADQSKKLVHVHCNTRELEMLLPPCSGSLFILPNNTCMHHKCTYTYMYIYIYICIAMWCDAMSWAARCDHTHRRRPATIRDREMALNWGAHRPRLRHVPNMHL